MRQFHAGAQWHLHEVHDLRINIRLLVSGLRDGKGAFGPLFCWGL
jgi:hypothetical protein